MALFRFDVSSIKQIAACLVASLPVFMAGIVLGWPSPVFTYIRDGHAVLQLTDSEQSLMIACIDIGNFAMAVPAGWLMDRMGRKFAVNASAPLMLVGWMCLLFSRRAWCLYVGRLLQGAAVGIAWVVSPAYVGEMASARIRGQLGLMVQLCYAGGLLSAYAAGWLLNDYTALVITSASVSVASCVLFQFLPESPYFLMLNGYPEAAARSLSRLRSYADDAQLHDELAAVKDSVLNDRHRGTVRDLFSRDLRPLVIVLTLAVLQMACGASVLEAYASTILSATESPISDNLAAVVLGLIIVAAAVPFVLAVDRFGRRPLMIASCLGAAACHASLALFLARARDDGTGGWAPVFASMAGAQFFINIGLMPVLSVVQCEYFPSDTRALADTAVVLVVTATSTAAITAFNGLTAAYGVAANFVCYAVLSLAGAAFCAAFMPETKCKSFVEIQMDFRGIRPSGPDADGDPDADASNKCEYERI